MADVSGSTGCSLAACGYSLRDLGQQQIQLERLADLLPLTQIRFPQLFGTTVGPDEIAQLADVLTEAITALPEPVSP